MTPQATAYIRANLPKLAHELRQWNQTGNLYGGSHIQQLARLLPIPLTNGQSVALDVAKALVVDAALDQATKPPPTNEHHDSHKEKPRGDGARGHRDTARPKNPIVEALRAEAEGHASGEKEGELRHSGKDEVSPRRPVEPEPPRRDKGAEPEPPKV